ncbi:MAG TPA: peptide chain release factor 1 [Acidiphilium sp.]|nr:MAG: peptide chain release factor 1 [Acidiphilium sp. 21-60-14]OYV89723.1 MAG: peptide chain release factor 1 [Acidiphilium sp. 37-60-79]OZB41195.1 MAG: peptide chain release factor 1 [Acidiphilium sp. 34-60-192]HQT89883.1 peptide chain release factor 1 [Acidiphilium sp.]HQU25156.1 peptide chain release factor 1 [Acidiphilium sp.]
MSLDHQLDRIAERAHELRAMLASGLDGERFVAASRELAGIEPLEALIQQLRAGQRAQAEAEAARADLELRELADAELALLHEQLPALEREIRLLLLPRDEADDLPAILEIRPAAGGDEAGLFAAELFAAYRRYADLRGWRFENLDYTESELGGLKEGIAEITGKSVFARLKYESGVHRVQRVPSTETQGRIHTSTITVAVLPEAEDVDIAIDEGDLRIDVYRASGAGGQHVNKTESAVRITHLPTGIVVAMQEERSQHKNRAKAMKVLRSRIYDAERARADAGRAADRKSQVGTGDRSERIRTYNFPQGRVTDHRINLTLHKIDRIMQGEFDDIIEALIAHDQAAKLAAQS